MVFHKVLLKGDADNFICSIFIMIVVFVDKLCLLLGDQKMFFFLPSQSMYMLIFNYCHSFKQWFGGKRRRRKENKREENQLRLND